MYGVKRVPVFWWVYLLMHTLDARNDLGLILFLIHTLDARRAVSTLLYIHPIELNPVGLL